VGGGVAAALRDDDFVVDYDRGFAEWIARGIDLVALGAERSTATTRSRSTKPPPRRSSGRATGAARV
jgi:hypothetical protein